jgi:hypothetical protein
MTTARAPNEKTVDSEIWRKKNQWALPKVTGVRSLV